VPSPAMVAGGKVVLSAHQSEENPGCEQLSNCATMATLPIGVHTYFNE
jgi:hypothetical protein